MDILAHSVADSCGWTRFFLLAIVLYAIVIKSCNKKDQHLVENRSFAETAREESVVSDQSYEQKPKVRMTRSFVSTDYDEFGNF